MKTSYHRIEKKSEGLFKDRGSKFLAFSFYVANEDEIRSCLDELRKRYHDARHHCYAWRLGPEAEKSRANDDGEPSNSAGKPILNQLEKHDLSNTLIVVIRYFGGTLLGVGGLINAYRTAAEDAIRNAKLIKEYIYNVYELRFEYPLMKAVMKAIKDHQLDTYDQKFELSCSIKVKVVIDKAEKVYEMFNDLYGCEIHSIDNRVKL